MTHSSNSFFPLLSCGDLFLPSLCRHMTLSPFFSQFKLAHYGRTQGMSRLMKGWIWWYLPLIPALKRLRQGISGESEQGGKRLFLSSFHDTSYRVTALRKKYLLNLTDRPQSLTLGCILLSHSKVNSSVSSTFFHP
jgi:hypothetical protein